MIKRTFALMIALSAIPALSFASGGDIHHRESNIRHNIPQKQQVDQAYEYGKAIYTGRIKEIGKIKYCVNSGDEKIKVKSSSLKPFKNSTYTELASHLYDCELPDELVYSKLGGDNTTLLLYYLNKRYKLNLE